MSRLSVAIFTGFLSLAVLVNGAAHAASGSVPSPLVDSPLSAAQGEQVAVLAGGCFWGVEAVFEHVKGVTGVTSGYSGGSAKTARYDLVSTGTTGHAEAVRVTYDPAQVSYGQLLRVFFSVAHDPTELNRQGPDTGTQYRSAIFYTNPEQQRIAQAYIAQLNRAKVFGHPVVTQITSLGSFFQAEAYHQDYAALHPDQPYIAINDLPKVTSLREELPELYRAK